MRFEHAYYVQFYSASYKLLIYSRTTTPKRIGESVKESQEKVKKFVAQYNYETSVENRLLDLCSELGELAKEILKSNNYGKQEFKINEHFRDELGDVLFSIICLANSTDTDLEEALSFVLNKYARRLS